MAHCRPGARLIALVFALLVATSFLFATAAGAAGAVRFAAPGGTGTDPCSEKAHPCRLFIAATRVNGTTIKAGDEVVLAPGEYTAARGDLGSSGSITIAQGVTLRGEPGKARPVIASAPTSQFNPVVTVTERDVVSDIEVKASVTKTALASGGTVEEVIVRSSTPGGLACEPIAGLMRDTVCLSSGAGGAALGQALDGFQSATIDPLRNVTAIASGEHSAGIRYSTKAIAGTVTVIGRSVIARGTESDVSAASTMGGGIVLELDHSDYEMVTTSKVFPQSTVEVSDPKTRFNVTARPLLAADGYHELRSSPTVDAGAFDAESGATDIDGQSRQVGSAVDIGADELADPTAAMVSCSPSVVLVGGAATCTATVLDTVGVPTVPTGAIRFTTDGPGSFDGLGTCQLGAGTAGRASCQTVYTPTATGSAPHSIGVDYAGDAVHDGSSDGAKVVVTVPDHGTETNLRCSPVSVELGKSTNCTATVTDTTTAGATPPTGEVRFQGAAGSVVPPTCNLASTGQTTSCSVRFTPAALGDATLEASYEGDSLLITHAPSSGSTTVHAVPAVPRPGPEGGGPGGSGGPAAGTPGGTAPNTVIKTHPRKRAEPGVALFRFTSTEPGSHFQCKIDKKPYKACHSPLRIKHLGAGAHSLSVRAVGAGGLVDPTPARFRWTVKR